MFQLASLGIAHQFFLSRPNLNISSEEMFSFYICIILPWEIHKKTLWFSLTSFNGWDFFLRKDNSYKNKRNFNGEKQKKCYWSAEEHYNLNAFSLHDNRLHVISLFPFTCPNCSLSFVHNNEHFCSDNSLFRPNIGHYTYLKYSLLSGIICWPFLSQIK